ncbi:MAG: DUF2063 domain-containing protein [Aquabacterium sp.]|nr:MAG: DUF2063 domain-containing protein [Aquabacterium sp.]
MNAEASRQQALLALLWRRPAAHAARAGLDAARSIQGLAAYRGNARAVAERALAAACPTIRAMLGEEDFAQLAHELWLAHPPERGDLGEWGAALPAHLRAHDQLGAWPWLPDCAQLDWAVHCCERAADAAFEPASLALLEQAEPGALRLALLPGTAVLRSAHPLATLHAAHAGTASLDAARAALAAGHGEDVIVWRRGWRAAVQALPVGWAGFMADLLQPLPLGPALERGGDLDFAAWLPHAIQAGWLWRIQDLTTDECPR